MRQNSGPRVLAIAIDAAESTLVRRMIGQDAMPALEALLAKGRWLPVHAPAYLGSASVWPTFISGCSPSEHGIYGEWCWNPGTMSLHRYHGGHLVPFWKSLTAAGATVGILDVPFMPMLGLRQGFEISEWGPHDVLQGRLEMGPEGIGDLVSQSPPHPLSTHRLDCEGPHDRENLTKLAASCLAGIETRGALAERLIRETRPHLALVTFTEIHHAAHYLWHTEEPEDEIYARGAFRDLPTTKPSLRDLYGAVDRQIGGLIDSCGEETQVMVFALHGMQPAHGMPTCLTPVLCEMGFARLADWQGQSWTGRATSLMAAVKRHAPGALRKLYYQTLPPSTTQRLARPTMLAAHDWSQTRAFSLPSDQHGWIRLNLIGREAEGIVPVAEYDAVCRELETSLRSLTTPEEKPLVRDVIRTAQCAQDAVAQHLPDLVVHWDNAVFAAPLRIRGIAAETVAGGRKFTGQHALDGFCIASGDGDPRAGETLMAEDLGSLMSRHLSERAR